MAYGQGGFAAKRLERAYLKYSDKVVLARAHIFSVPH